MTVSLIRIRMHVLVALLLVLFLFFARAFGDVVPVGVRDEQVLLLVAIVYRCGGVISCLLINQLFSERASGYKYVVRLPCTSESKTRQPSGPP